MDIFTPKPFHMGIDEVGRGPWAGPVMAAAVMWPEGVPVLEGVTDSKKLSAKKREILAEQILNIADVGVGSATVEEIDRINIREATFLAMERAVGALKGNPVFAWVDGNAIPKNLPCASECVIKGDSKVYTIGCASIVAKVLRDAEMARLHDIFPHFAWDSNAGYGTKAHQEGLKVAGVTPHHRRSFAPIRTILQA
jgi:ribonuclease HII